MSEELYLEKLGIKPSQIFSKMTNDGKLILSINKSGIIGLIKKHNITIYIEKWNILPFRENQSIAVVEVTVTREIDGKKQSAPGVASLEKMSYAKSSAYIVQTAMTYAVKDAVIFLLGITDEDVLDYATKHGIIKNTPMGKSIANVENNTTSAEEKLEIEAVKIDDMDWGTM